MVGKMTDKKMDKEQDNKIIKNKNEINNQRVKETYIELKKLVNYGLQNDLLESEDQIYVRNQLLELLELDEYEDLPYTDSEIILEEVLNHLVDYAVLQGIVKEDSIVYRDLFDTKLMGVLVPKPSEVIRCFQALYQKAPKDATDYYYKLSQDTDYIRRYRIKKDVKWVVDTEYGEIDITINLSKPEKDPKAIAAAKHLSQSGYPKCLLCKENEGYAGRLNHPARQNHRIIPITIHEQDWGFQYSPYVYYNEHCIVFHSKHLPMKIDRSAFRKLFDFVKQFPHYFVGSNADLPIVGGSILTHDHFQGGNYQFAMAKAPIEKEYSITGYEDVNVGTVKWPMSVIRIRCKDETRLVELGDYILNQWRVYSDKAVSIFAYSNEEPHNTITPIARKVGDTYEMDLVLRNNITTKEHPLGLFHPHAKLHHIKKENIGLIEVMGLAVLPSRLKEEMELLAEYITWDKDIREDETLEKHADWVDEFKPKYKIIDKENVEDIIRTEIGIVFSKVLEHAGVFKRDTAGQQAFERFIQSLNNERV